MKKSSKKYYSSPLLEVIGLDVELLIQPPSNAEPNRVSPVGVDKPASGPFNAPKASHLSPFGGNSPDYRGL